MKICQFEFRGITVNIHYNVPLFYLKHNSARSHFKKVPLTLFTRSRSLSQEAGFQSQTSVNNFTYQISIKTIILKNNRKNLKLL